MRASQVSEPYPTKLTGTEAEIATKVNNAFIWALNLLACGQNEHFILRL